ncbi:DSBA-like thioredoxin domain protein [Moelleriella libera RCEF 2490]|uniref:DSBA-like thioredoxin domain protein n=1 Tax=Moelleriella libera RCEF 2490 TaxID=1081109 RepID=A0A168CMX4_9HYPO|nr:DSBA-like thioredoxin domain protein [Moelleriella libera RCEF 2490]
MRGFANFALRKRLKVFSSRVWLWRHAFCDICRPMPSFEEAKKLLVPIEVYSDTLCPWCWVEKHSLQAAVQDFEKQHPEVEFEIIWRSFCLNPLLKTKCDKFALYDEWSGGPGKFQQHLDRVGAAGSKYGLRLSVTGLTGPSRSSQILIANVLRRSGPAAQALVVEALFQSHFTLGEDISDQDFLVSLGSEITGQPADTIRSELENPENGRFVDYEVDEAAASKGVEAVPCVTVLSKYKVGGFQEQHVFEQLFERIWAESFMSE